MSDLSAGLFEDPEVSGCLSDRSRVQAMLDVEAELALALARVEIIPDGAARAIRGAASSERYDIAAIAIDSARSGNIAIPLVRALTREVQRLDAVAAGFVHWGATSQDIIDTAFVLELRAAVSVIQRKLARAADAAAGLARLHVRTIMPGRTWLQHATPITFGLKAAGWADALDRAGGRVSEALSRACVLQLGGAAGTLAAFGPRAIDVARELGRALDLTVPPIPWHAHRDRLADLGCALGVTVGAGGKIGRDIALLSQTEVAEVAESMSGGSSTMPQKRNPVGAAAVLAAAARAPGLVATMLTTMPQEHERGLGGWQADGEALRELVRIAGGAASALVRTVETLVVDPDRMGRNLASSGGLIMAEAAALALGRQLGKHRAHELVSAAAARATANGQSLEDALADDALVTEHCPRPELSRLLDPMSYLGASVELVEQFLEQRGRGA